MTRPIERIPAYLSIIEKAWRESPDLRFWQLLSNMGGISFHEEDNNFFDRFWQFYWIEWKIWGTRWKEGNKPLKYIPINELEKEHIENILATQQHIDDEVKLALSEELIKRIREEKGIKTKTKEELKQESYERHAKFVLDIMSTQP